MKYGDYELVCHILSIPSILQTDVTEIQEEFASAAHVTNDSVVENLDSEHQGASSI